MLNSKIENLIDELPQASNKRVEEIVTILEGVLSDIECNIPIEDDSDRAYKCQNISKAQDIIVLIRAWNSKSEDRESELKIMNNLVQELKTTFNQI
jgi:flagellin-specific chaperone FliS